MIETLKDILVVCDMDNTLLTAKEGIPACNRAAIQLFQALGGRFTVATGRPVESVRAALDGLKLSCPAITCGGSVLYDFQTEEVLVQHSLDESSARQAILDVMQRFPDVGVEVMVEEGRVYVVQANQYTTAHVQNEKMSHVMCPLDRVPSHWAKVVFAANPVMLAQVQELIGKTTYPNIYFLPTNFIYFEIMPQNVGKAQALSELCRRELMGLENVIVIGDYFNDMDLMRQAGRSVAVGNAPPEVKAIADEVVSRCMDGGVGEYLYSLVKRYT